PTPVILLRIREVWNFLPSAPRRLLRITVTIRDSLRAQGLCRVLSRRASGGDGTGAHRQNENQRGGYRQPERVPRIDSIKQRREQLPAGNRTRQSDDDAAKREAQGFAQDQALHVGRTRTERDSDADLAAP